jgi:hypothetical protein
MNAGADPCCRAWDRLVLVCQEHLALEIESAREACLIADRTVHLEVADEFRQLLHRGVANSTRPVVNFPTVVRYGR